ncbi:hypothetical protein OUY22_09035 [Nonomuraea sp. MCN248]|uniref:Uncharacterized protein n=1 Tax=Nonomuraea corallina TaxID=2989783 RepID=A0ABT4S8Q7_9ACTN|nr:hypothetical protein [Nonomuraea corallina]MDA0633561.1 hypothetical protein [Nonomuraea corallina]
MSEQPGFESGRDIGAAQEVVPRPPGATPGIEDSIDEHELRRLTELNPDDFE